jgi:hypothetical protein
MMNDPVKARGYLTFELTSPDGVKHFHTENMVVNVGLARIAQRLAGSANAMSHMAVGTGITGAAAGNTTLVTENGRVALTSTTVVTTTVTNDSVEYVASFAAGTGTGAVTEAGLFDNVSAGTMLARSVFSAINKGANDSLTITWKVVMA